MKTIFVTVLVFFLILLAPSVTFSQQVKIIEPINILASGSEEYQIPKISHNGKIVAFGGADNNGIFITDYFGGEINS